MNNLRQHYFESRANLPAKIRSALAVLAIAVPMCTALPVQASTFTVGGSGNTFTVTRLGDTSAAETVHYRTVPLSAFPGQHYTEKSGTLVFAPGQTGTNITVSAASMSNAAYMYQAGTSRAYSFEILDEGGFWITNATRSVSSGLVQFKADKVSKSVTDLVTFSGGSFSSGMSSGKYLDVAYTPPSGQVETSGTLAGYVLIDDSYDYAQKPAMVSADTLIASTGARADYLGALDYKIYATVCFTEKERDDGYQYLQIVAGNTASYDTGADPNGKVNDPTNSVYKVCFELADGSNAEGKAFFPHRGTDTTEFSLSTGKLWQQKYKDGYAAGSSGSVVLPVTTAYITTRFDAGGDNDDTWGYKDLFVRMALVDDTYPTLFNNSSAAIRVDPGPHCKGNAFYIIVPFNEIVYSSRSKTISTTWGDAVYHSGDGSNVITFKGTITADAGTMLKITGGTCNFRDLSYNYFQGSLNKTFNGKTVSASHAYPITYDLGGGMLSANSPTSYTYDAAVSLVQPTRTGYTFDGWTGSNGATKQKSVTIYSGSHGPRSYVAHWTPVTYTITYGLAGGALPAGAANPVTYAITNAAFTLANPVRTGYAFAGWTGTGIDGSTNEVTVAVGSHGPRSYAATWSANAYRVRFNDNDGSPEPRYQGFSYDQPQSLDPAIARTGYDFSGWCTNEDVTVIFANCAVVSNLTAEADGVVDLYARWVGHSYIVRFDGNAADAVGSTDEMGLTYDVPDNLTSNGFSRTGYDFAGWSTNANGAVVYSDGASVSNLTAEANKTVTFYAQWAAHTYTFRFDTGADGVTGAMPDQTFAYDARQALTSNAFTRTGYTFAGWRGADGSIYPDGATVIVRYAYHTEGIWKHFDRMPYPGKTNDDYRPGDGAIQNTDGDNGVNLYTGFENCAWDPTNPALADIISANAAWFDEHDARNGVSMKLIEDFPNFYIPNFYIEQVDDAQGGVVTLSAIWLPHVPYIDADGNEQMCTDYTVLTSAAGDVEYVEWWGESWYVVTNDVTISGNLWFTGVTNHLILCDGATLTVTNANGTAIGTSDNLAIYCQANGTGMLIVNGSDDGIFAWDNIIINGGSITATGGNGIYANGDIILGWTNPTDSITASSYYAPYITVKSGQSLTDGSNIYEGNLDPSAIAGMTLRPWRNYNDPEGVAIEYPSVVDWLMANDFTQSDIDALGSNATATEKLYECYLLNCSITAANPGGALSITGIAVGNDQISVTVQLVRHWPLGTINGELHLYGTDDLADDFVLVAETCLDFGDGDSTFDTDKVLGPLTQSVTATMGTYDVRETFFKAAIEFRIP